eukprot:6555451-Pyramimonas_sp.AAC.1
MRLRASLSRQCTFCLHLRPLSPSHFATSSSVAKQCDPCGPCDIGTGCGGKVRAGKPKEHSGQRWERITVIMLMMRQ